VSAVGRVYVIGAGPGSPDLISLRGWRALLSADAVLADRLLPRDFLEQLGISVADKTVQWLGTGGMKDEGSGMNADSSSLIPYPSSLVPYPSSLIPHPSSLPPPRWSQDAINRWLVLHAQSGQTVVRLKGGDPFVFGRGDDEIQCLAEHGIPWEVIPGPSSCTAVPAAAGHPLTRHARDRSFAVATARVTGGAIQESFPRADSLVVLMGIGVLPLVVARLLADGWAPDAPVAVIERGTLPCERRVSGTLSQIAQLARGAGIASPGLVIVGGTAVGGGRGEREKGRRGEEERGRTSEGVAGIAASPPHQLSLSPLLPLSSSPFLPFSPSPVILFTGSDPEDFRTLGDLLHWPALRLVPDQEGRSLLPSVFARLRGGAFDWIVLSGKLAVTSLFAAMAEQGVDARILATAKIAAVGQAAALRLREFCLQADAVIEGKEEGGRRKDENGIPVSHSSFLLPPSSLPFAGQTVAAIHGTHVPGELGRRIEDVAAAVTHVTLHSVAPHPELGRPLPQHDAVYFVSPSGVEAYWEAYGAAGFREEVWCLGEATQATIARHGVGAKVVLPIPATDLASCAGNP
jgi:siroheme synthase/uroporphyrinogen-III synthase